ncbi:hypothetical protein CRV24_002552 [Beauveria bassiana]|nr:hypothetical protein CRV24_002552 [Beauveria bassiana]
MTSLSPPPKGFVQLALCFSFPKCSGRWPPKPILKYLLLGPESVPLHRLAAYQSRYCDKLICMLDREKKLLRPADRRSGTNTMHASVLCKASSSSTTVKLSGLPNPQHSPRHLSTGRQGPTLATPSRLRGGPTCSAAERPNHARPRGLIKFMPVCQVSVRVLQACI